ncbi:ABC transporter ATP-binding protein [Pelagibacterium lacus]|uniref:ABC transporter ATP-binding protein n=1 Tax=Pelagibacterium lacus TaxID=2282655 RepID=A0A369W1J5_9HYPH|nr:ABC transporter ATP-binding protein [Pelagibacterium lacus]RDE07755.1 ABC transporter ATP-binding protein [Pelagibacterium lacus]
MILNLFRLGSNPALVYRLGILTALRALVQGMLLALLIPIFHALLQPQPDFAAAGPWLTGAAVCLIIYWLLSAIATPAGFAASIELGDSLRHRVMEHVTRLPLGWFTPDQKARLSRAVTVDTTAIGHLAVELGSPAITATIVPLSIIVISFFIDWRMALVFAAIAPLAFITLKRAGDIASKADEELDAASTELAGRAIELGQAQIVLRAAGQAESGSARMQSALDAHRDVYREGLRKSMVPDLTYTGTVTLGFTAILLLGAWLLTSGEIGLADAVVLLILAVRFMEPLGVQIELIGALRAMDNAVARVRSILDTKPLPEAPKPVRHIEDASISFEDVTFGYSDAPALEKVSFDCAPGTMTALVGPSGSGKTTVTRLIARFHDVDSGTIRIGGHDLRQLDNVVLMEEIAIVFQDVYLFDTTIEENLRIAHPEATEEEFAAAARAARLNEVVSRLPHGWQTRVGEGGAQLSGGERQRVSIARAFLKQARIVLIDEASSALDPENERAVAEAIANLSSDGRRTVIVIAHRPVTLAAADQVITLDKGRVVEIGSPEHLRQSGGVFARLFSQYERARSWRIEAVEGASQ